jgi:hypothetical protein
LSRSDFAKDGFAIFPNPVKNSFNINNANATEIAVLELFDIAGKLLLSKNILNNNLQNVDVSALSKGVYMVRISATDGRTYVSKFVKDL